MTTLAAQPPSATAVPAPEQPPMMLGRRYWLAAARALGEHSPARKAPSGSLLPALRDVRAVAQAIATAVDLALRRRKPVMLEIACNLAPLAVPPPRPPRG
ncbi:MAG: hypothetical protein ACLQGP_10160 [Isosphaeraceae bacterium]